MSDIETPTKEIVKPYRERTGDIAKVHLICGSRVSELVINVVGEIDTTMTDLIIERIKLDVLMQQTRRLASDALDYEAKVAAVWKEILPMLLPYAERCSEAAARIAPLAADVIMAVRADLKTPGYEPGFVPPFQRSAEKQLAHVRCIMKKMRQAHGID